MTSPDWILQNYAIVDVETTTRNQGHVYDPSNALCYVGYRDVCGSRIWTIDVGGIPYGSRCRDVQGILNGKRIWVAFNAKFDLNWLRRYGISPSKEHRIFDLQLAFFILRGQDRRYSYASLDQVLDYYGLPPKDHNIEENYWKKGIDTNQIPELEIKSYLDTDLIREEQVLLCELEELRKQPQLQRLVWLACQDELVTAEMEWNGIKYDTAGSLREGELLDLEIEGIDRKLRELVSFPHLNWNSNDHISAALYGGIVKYRVRERYERTLKGGKTSEREHWVDKEESLPRLVEPLRGSELKKEGYFATNEKTLKSLRASGTARRLIQLLLTRAKLEKLNGTYYKGIPKKFEEFAWEDGLLHPTLNHCVATTGRLSSSNPNSQNLDEKVRKFIITRF